jgi:hypothetical protein
MVGRISMNPEVAQKKLSTLRNADEIAGIRLELKKYGYISFRKDGAWIILSVQEALQTINALYEQQKKTRSFSLKQGQLEAMSQYIHLLKQNNNHIQFNHEDGKYEVYRK